MISNEEIKGSNVVDSINRNFLNMVGNCTKTNRLTLFKASKPASRKSKSFIGFPVRTVQAGGLLRGHTVHVMQGTVQGVHT